MTKVELVSKIKGVEGTSAKQVEAVLEKYGEVIEEAVKAKDSVPVVGVGTIEQKEVKGREGECMLEAAKGKKWKSEDSISAKLNVFKSFKAKVNA